MTLRLPGERRAWLDQAEGALEAVASAVRREMAGLAPAELVWKPGADRWSVAHCLAHLTRTNRLYRDALAAGFDVVEADGAPRGNGDGVRLRGSWTGRLLARLVGPDVVVRVRAPTAFRPVEEAVGAGAPADFLEEQRRWIELVRRGRHLPLDEIRIASPVARLVRVRASDAVAIVVNHEERHLAQARAVLRAPGFPAGR